MRSAVGIAFLSFAACAAPAASYAQPGAGTGAADIVSESRPVRGFHAIELAGPGRLVVRQGDRESLVVRAERRLMPYLETVVTDDRLELRLDFKDQKRSRMASESHRSILFEVTVVSLSGLEVSGPGSVDIAELDGKRLSLDLSGPSEVDIGRLAVGELDLSISGPAAVRLCGQVARQSVDISGPGDYIGERLASRSARITISGPGSARVTAIEDLDVTISGIGDVRYLGNPRIRRSITGIGSVARLRR